MSETITKTIQFPIFKVCLYFYDDREIEYEILKGSGENKTVVASGNVTQHPCVFHIEKDEVEEFEKICNFFRTNIKIQKETWREEDKEMSKMKSENNDFWVWFNKLRNV